MLSHIGSTREGGPVHLINRHSAIRRAEQAFEFSHRARGRDEFKAPGLDLHKFDTITRLDVQHAADVGRDGDPAFAGEGGGGHLIAFEVCLTLL